MKINLDIARYKWQRNWPEYALLFFLLLLVYIATFGGQSVIISRFALGAIFLALVSMFVDFES